MRAEQWIELLKKIPLEEHEHLVAATTQSAEVAIQQILQINEHYFVVRGRLGGSTDAGRIFCLPYERMLYLVVNRPMNDHRVMELFGPLLQPPRGEIPTSLVTETLPQPEPTPVTPTPLDSPTPGKRSAAASLRERLRTRIATPAPAPTPVPPVRPQSVAPAAGAATETPAAAASIDGKANTLASLRERLRARFGAAAGANAPAAPEKPPDQPASS
jgi:hypothetical protein